MRFSLVYISTGCRCPGSGWWLQGCPWRERMSFPMLNTAGSSSPRAETGLRGGWREEAGCFNDVVFHNPKSISYGNKIKFPQAKCSSLRKGEWASCWWGGNILAKVLLTSSPPCCWIFLPKKRDCHFVRGSSRPGRWLKMALTHSTCLGSCFLHEVNLQYENSQSSWAMILFFCCHEASWDIYLGRLFLTTTAESLHSPCSLTFIKGQTRHPMLHG